MKLTDEDLAFIREICKDPPPITFHMKNAIKSYRRRVSGDDSYRMVLSEDDIAEMKEILNETESDV